MALIGNGEPGPWGLAAIGLALFVAFVVASRRAAAGSDRARGAALIETGLLTMGAVLAFVVAQYLLELRCDDRCVEPSQASDWDDTSGAWQWSAQFAAASAGLVAVVGSFVQTLRRRHWSAVACLAVGAASLAAWIGFVAELGNEFGV